VRAAVVLPTDLMVQRAMPVPTTRALRMVQVLQRKQAEVHMVEWLRWQSGLHDEETKAGIHYHRLTREVPHGGVATRARFLMALTKDIRDRIVRTRPDGIVVQDEELLWASVQAKRKLGVPLFYDSQEHFVGMVAEERPREAKLYEVLERRASRHLDHVYTAVEGVAEHFRKLGCEATVVYNSRDLAETRPFELPLEEAKRLLGLPQDSFLLGFTGSINDDRGLKPCVEALAKLPSDVHMVVLGGPTAKLQELTDLAARLGVTKRFHPLAPVPPEEAVRVGCAFDAGLMTLVGEGPQFTYRLPYKFFDYMALGTPIIVSDYPDMRRLAGEEVRFGVVVPPGSAEAIAKAALQLRADPRERRAMSERARGAFESRYCGELQKERLRASHPFWR
jgi:glycosyltransferase involved in cell wall biosynthesis